MYCNITINITTSLAADVCCRIHHLLQVVFVANSHPGAICCCCKACAADTVRTVAVDMHSLSWLAAMCSAMSQQILHCDGVSCAGSSCQPRINAAGSTELQGRLCCAVPGAVCLRPRAVWQGTHAVVGAAVGSSTSCLQEKEFPASQRSGCWAAVAGALFSVDAASRHLCRPAVRGGC